MTAPAQPTPGPWETRGDHVGVWHRYKSGVKDMIHFVALASVSIPRRRKEVRSYHDGVAEMTANARLIAAAPSLLAALDALVGRAENEGEVRAIEAEGMIDAADMQGYELGKCIKQARALLAEIRGAR